MSTPTLQADGPVGTVAPQTDGKTDDALTAGLQRVPIAPARPTPRQRMAEGKGRRHQTPRTSHADWRVTADRNDPLALLEKSNSTRLKHLVPIRYGRMTQSPFQYLRGSPIVMAHDLASTPVSRITVQMCGDAHIMNFGVYATPE